MVASISADLGPLRAFIDQLANSPQKLRMDIARGLYGAAEEVMTASKEIVPVDTGALKSTGVVLQPVISANHVDVTLGYGGPARGGRETGRSGRKRPVDVGYAWYVHENMNAHFHGNGQPKYLERPLMEKVRHIAERIGGGLVEWWRGI